MHSSARMTPVPGNRYDPAVLVATGGMSKVYWAEDRDSGLPVALKIVAAEGDDPALACLENEAHVLTHLEVFDDAPVAALVDRGERYLALEWVDGVPLPEWLARGRSAAELLSVCRHVLAALACLHRAGVTHGDLKPTNVLVRRATRTRSLDVVLIDFGLAVVDGDAVDTIVDDAITGTPAYMAPELFAGEARTRRSDVYAAGALVYEILSGAPPFDGRDVTEVTTRQLLDPVVPLSLRCPELGLPGEIDQVVARALCKRPEDRPTDATALAVAFDEAVAGLEEREDLAMRVARAPAADLPTAVAARVPLASSVEP